MAAGITFRQKGDFSKLEKFLNRLRNKEYLNIISRYGEMGVAALSSATPKDSGKTASSWNYEIIQNEETTSIVFTNSNVVVGGTSVALLLQYGHGTRNGGYVVGRDYINPAIRPVFDQLAKDVWKEVTKT